MQRSMARSLLVAALTFVAVPRAAAAQADPLFSQARFLHQGMTMILLQSAERMPAEHYDFRPAPAVRTYAQVLGHIAEMYYLHCAVLRGERTPTLKIDSTATAKSEVIVALRGATAYCDPVFAALTDSSGMAMVGFRGSRITRHSLINVHFMHAALHYGNLITYMRLKEVVPPTSDPSLMPPEARP